MKYRRITPKNFKKWHTRRTKFRCRAVKIWKTYANAPVPLLTNTQEKYEGQTILVAAHDAVNKAIICDLLGLDMSHFWHIKQDNACINVLEYNEGVWRAVLLNSTTHLGYLFSGVEQAGL